MYTQPGWEGMLLFHEYFDPETGRGCGANHQTGWTALVARCLDHIGTLRASRRRSTVDQTSVDSRNEEVEDKDADDDCDAAHCVEVSVSSAEE